jgi:hypothetical protein
LGQYSPAPHVSGNVISDLKPILWRTSQHQIDYRPIFRALFLLRDNLDEILTLIVAQHFSFMMLENAARMLSGASWP